jgi:hypothetical protein
MSTTASQDNRISVWRIIVIILVIVESISLFIIYNQYRNLKNQIPYSPHEQVYVNRAIQSYVQKHRLPEKEVMKGRFPVAAMTRDGLCVNIRGLTGRIGHVPIYCYDKDGRLVFQEER